MPPKRRASAAFKGSKETSRTAFKGKGKAPASRPLATKSSKHTGQRPRTGQGSNKKVRAALPSENPSDEDEDDPEQASDMETADADDRSSASEQGAAESSNSEPESDTNSDMNMDMTTPRQGQRNRKAASTPRASTALSTVAGPSARNKKPGSDSRAVRRVSPPSSPADLDEAPPVVPEKLLTALLYSNFQQPDTKIGRDARGLVGKYVETFIREAVARAVVERTGSTTVASQSGGGAGDFLEVEDLEKLAPQLILDF